MGFRITTWNVNGIKNPFSYQPWRENRTFQAMFDTLEADIVVMQEAKIQRKDLTDDMVLVPGWDVYFSLPKHKKGYSGVAIYTRSSKCSPIRAEEGITGTLAPPNSSTRYRDLPPEQQIGGYPKPGQLSSAVDEATLDSEGRCVILEFPAFVLIGVYTPATRDETRTEFREGFINALDIRVRNLVAMGKQVFLCGDLNIIRAELDTAGLQDRLRKEGMTREDFFSSPPRRFLNQVIHGGTVFGERDEGREEPVLWDLCREFHPARQGMYTCWETKKNARPGNFGSRIDYVLCSQGIKDWFIDSNIQEGLLGSDHCPVYATISDTVTWDGVQVHLTDIMNPEGMFKDGKRLREWNAKDLLPTSAKLLPEFNNRRSIRDMFFKKPVPKVNQEVSSTSLLEPAASASTLQSAAQVECTQVLSQEPSSQASTSTNATPPQKLPQKRAMEPLTTNRPQKKTKAALKKEGSAKSGPGLGQSSLKGFFRPKIDSGVNKEPEDGNSSAPAKDSPTTDPAPQDVKEAAGLPEANPELESVSIDKVYDPIESKASWSKLLGKPVLPKCEHGEDCQMFTTKKPGINCGRAFFVCSRPLGPSGDKETGTEFRCPTFIWKSDWNSRPQ